jgi:hypothetical protein
MAKASRKLGVLLLAAWSATCGLIPESVSFDDPRVVEMMAATNTVNRASLGFTPISREAKLRLESRAQGKYDAMPHVYGKTSRTIAFRLRSDRYEWIGEQEIFEGPREFDTKEPVSGVPLNAVTVDYRGEDPHLADRRPLSLTDVKPILAAWGYLTEHWTEISS